MAQSIHDALSGGGARLLELRRRLRRGHAWRSLCLRGCPVTTTAAEAVTITTAVGIAAALATSSVCAGVAGAAAVRAAVAVAGAAAIAYASVSAAAAATAAVRRIARAGLSDRKARRGAGILNLLPAAAHWRAFCLIPARKAGLLYASACALPRSAAACGWLGFRTLCLSCV